jgi:hypothetical protein
MTLISWIKKVGVKTAANRLGRAESTIRAYVAGQRVPARKLAERMSSLTNGKVGYRGCFPRNQGDGHGD